MKTKLVVMTLALLTLAAGVTVAAPLGTAFTYQGRLDWNGQAAPNGIYPMRFALYDAPAPGANQINRTNLLAVAVTNGLFTAELDFGTNAFTGEARWLDLAVSTDGAVSFIALLPRVRVAPTPNALYASTAGSVPQGSVQAGQFATAAAPSPGQVLAFNGSSLVWSNSGAPSPWLFSGSSAYYNGGSVGIGTATPGALLHLNSSASASSVLGAFLEPSLVNGGFDQIYLGRTPTGNGCATFTYNFNSITPASSFLSLGLYNSSFSLNVRGDGKVGIGTASPSELLELGNGGSVRISSDPGNDAAQGNVAYTLAARSTGGGMNSWKMYTAPVGGGFGVPANSLSIWQYPGDANHERFTILPTPVGGTQNQVVIDGTGSVGIGTSAPEQKLHVIGAFTLVEGLAGEKAYIGGDGVANDVQVGSLNPSVANVTFYNPGSQTFMNVVANQGYFQGDANCRTVTIRGGADLAEPFPMNDDAIEKGSVVVIDDEHPGRLKLSTRAYDTRVAGIVSGANGIHPGISLRQEGALDQGENVALSGRVYVKADASFGAIKPGDLLTTSETPGHATKVTDHARAQGAILGKAMSPLTQGTGLVLVLVTLQ